MSRATDPVTFFIQEEIVESCSAFMDMNTSNRGLSTMANGQLERMIDDAAWLTYPLHVLVGIIKMFLFVIGMIAVFLIIFSLWMFNSHDERAELVKSFSTRQTVFRVDIASNKATVWKPGITEGCTSYAKQYGQIPTGIDCVEPVTKEEFRTAFSGPQGSTELIRHIPTWLNRPLGPAWWLEEKNNEFDWAYIRSSRNLYELRNVMRYRDRTTTGEPVIPNVPVVYMSFMGCMHNCVPDANDGDFFTGMCLASAHCTEADFVPRNDSIFMDAIYPQMTANQEAAIDALNATGTQKFWEDAARANGWTEANGMNLVMAQWRITQERLNRDVESKKVPTESEDFIWDVAWGVIGFFAFTVVLCVCFARRT